MIYAVGEYKNVKFPVSGVAVMARSILENVINAHFCICVLKTNLKVPTIRKTTRRFYCILIASLMVSVLPSF